VRAPSILQRHLAWGWLLPAAVVVALGAAATGVLTSQSSSGPLPEINPRALAVALSTPGSGGYSGTILAQMSLGLDGAATLTDDSDDRSLMSLVSGSHTMRSWYGGPDRQRVALFGPTSETDVFRAGEQVWQWDSGTQVATHSTPGAMAGSAALTLAALTPQQLTERIVAAVDDTAQVSLGGQRQIADRPSYELVITPPAGVATRIGSVHIGVDGATKVPLSVQVYPRGGDAPAVDVAFTSITFKTPAPDYFTFSPPAGATVKDSGSAPLGVTAISGRMGTGWTAVAEYRTSATPARAPQLISAMAAILQPVSGRWGTGRLLDTPLLCVLVLPDGRVLTGAVDPAVLYAAAEN
jgi:outer membrane lipoprotein-sorting protein